MANLKYKLTEKILITGKVTALTGLLIGGTNTALAIGGPDKMVIRNPFNNEPYIPGSSLKGKMRALLEVSYGNIAQKSISKQVKWVGTDDISKATTQLFGNSPSDSKQRASRLIVRDGKLFEESAKILSAKRTDLPFTETKTEVVIDRITSAAMPRTFERVPAGAEFELSLVLNIIHDEVLPDTEVGANAKVFSKEELLKQTFKGLLLVQDDYLGGAGSRGSGQVKFEISKIVVRSSAYYRGENDAKELVYTSKENREDLKTKFFVPEDLLPQS